MDVGASFRQLQCARQAGITAIVATPHFYPDRHVALEFLARRDRALELLRSAADPAWPALLPGAEVLLCEGLHHLPELDRFCLGGKQALLVEMPDPPWNRRHLRTLEAIGRERGLRVVLAHPERFPPDMSEALLRSGYVGQLNAVSLLNPVRRRRFIHWIEEGFIVALGSDNHGSAGRGYREFVRAVRVLGPLGEAVRRETDLLVGVAE